MENGGSDRQEREDRDDIRPGGEDPEDIQSEREGWEDARREREGFGDARRERVDRAEVRRRRAYALRRAILDYGIGILIMCFGVFLLIAPKLGFSFSIDDLNRYMFSGLCLLYGGFRAWRGSKKNYFK